MKLISLIFAALVSAQNFYGTSPEGEGGDVISTHDRRGNISTVYNLFDGYNHSIQVTRLNADGTVQWTDRHADGMVEKAYAAAMDDNAGLFVVGMRRLYKQKFFVTLKYAENGYLEREVADDQAGCTAVGVAVDRDQNVVVAGACRYGTSFPARIVKYDNDLGLLWSQEFDGGGRNYVRGLSIDYQNNILLTVETVYGNYRDGSYETRTAVFDSNGRNLGIQ